MFNVGAIDDRRNEPKSNRNVESLGLKAPALRSDVSFAAPPDCVGRHVEKHDKCSIERCKCESNFKSDSKSNCHFLAILDRQLVGISKLWMIGAGLHPGRPPGQLSIQSPAEPALKSKEFRRFERRESRLENHEKNSARNEISGPGLPPTTPAAPAILNLHGHLPQKTDNNVCFSRKERERKSSLGAESEIFWHKIPSIAQQFEKPKKYGLNFTKSNLGRPSHAKAKHNLLFGILTMDVLNPQQSNLRAIKTINKNQQLKLLFLALEPQQPGRRARSSTRLATYSVETISNSTFSEIFYLRSLGTELESYIKMFDRRNNQFDQSVGFYFIKTWPSADLCDPRANIIKTWLSADHCDPRANIPDVERPNIPLGQQAEAESTEEHDFQGRQFTDNFDPMLVPHIFGPLLVAHKLDPMLVADTFDPLLAAGKFDPLLVPDTFDPVLVADISDPMQVSPDPMQVTSDDNLGAQIIQSTDNVVGFGQAPKVPPFLTFQATIFGANFDKCAGSYEASSSDPVLATYGCVNISDDFWQATFGNYKSLALESIFSRAAQNRVVRFRYTTEMQLTISAVFVLQPFQFVW